MSDANNISTLLPVSSVGVFVENKKLRKDIASLVDDWRFPRVHIDVSEGNVNTAIETYKTQATHDLIIIETETIDDSFGDCLEELSAYCTEDTAAIVVGPVNDVNLYRKLMAIGVSDYLVHPIKKEAIGDVIAAALIERVGTSKSKLVTILGAKGGVGTSSIAQAMALGCTEGLKQKTVLLDAAGGASYTAVALGQEPVTTLKEASRAALAEDKGSMKRMLVEVNEHLTLLGSGGDPLLEDPIQTDGFENILDALLTTFPVVIFDASSASIPIKRALLSRSHKICVVSTPTLSSLRASRTLIQEIKTLRGGEDEEGLIDFTLNMKGQFAGQEISKSEAESALEHKVSKVIDFDPKLFPAAEMDGVKITELKGSEALMANIMDGFTSFLGAKKPQETAKSKGFFDQILKKVKG